jgi:hypothetical protein
MGSTILVAIVVALAIRVALHFIDKSRIKDEIEAKGGRVVTINWNPLGRGWLLERNERHYSVTYRNRSGATISTDCKTSLFTGVYWAEGPSVNQPPRIISRRRCAKCGYAINAEWRACPNCGHAVHAA